MGWLSKLGTLAEIAGVVAAPFTGGGSLALSAASKGAKVANAASKVGKVAGVANTIGKVAGNTSAARAGARLEEAKANEGVDRLALDRAEQAQRARITDERSAVRGGLIEGLQDASIERPAGAGGRKMTGGLRPSAIVGKDAIGKKMKDDAIARLIAENSTPELTPTPKAGKLDSLLNFASSVAPIAGMMGREKAAPNVGINDKVSADPLAIVGATPTVTTDDFDPNKLPAQSKYVKPRFTPRF